MIAWGEAADHVPRGHHRVRSCGCLWIYASQHVSERSPGSCRCDSTCSHLGPGTGAELGVLAAAAGFAALVTQPGVQHGCHDGPRFGVSAPWCREVMASRGHWLGASGHRCPPGPGCRLTRRGRARTRNAACRASRRSNTRGERTRHCGGQRGSFRSAAHGWVRIRTRPRPARPGCVRPPPAARPHDGEHPARAVPTAQLHRTELRQVCGTGDGSEASGERVVCWLCTGCPRDLSRCELSTYVRSLCSVPR